MATETAADGTATRKKRYEPTDDDYDIAGIEIDEAENGVVITCRYKLKPEVEAKMRKASENGGPSPYSYCDFDSNREKHVFETQDAAKKFIMSELNDMWGDGATGDDE